MLLLQGSCGSCWSFSTSGAHYLATGKDGGAQRAADGRLRPRAYVERGLVGENASLKSVRTKERDARIRKQLQRVKLPPSSYDTAWVAMVPLRGSPQAPRFPQCVEWILENQQDNGSWGTYQFDLSVNKGILLSTLACVLALKRWNVGREDIRRGLNFIGRNFSTVMDEQIAAPVGFNITFAGMLSLGIEMGLEFPVQQTDLDGILHLREMELKRWDGHHKDEFYSEQVKIVFCALYTTVNQLGAKASAIQDRDVTKNLIEIWLQLLRSMMTEAEWQRCQYVPTVEEYIANAVVSFALGPIVLPALYFVGPKILEYVVIDQEYNELFRLMSTCGRLLNDSQGFEREGGEGKLNSVSLFVLHSGGSMSIEAAKKAIQKSIDTSRRDLLRLVLREESAVPRPCKELFWKMCKILHLFYFQTDGFSSPKEMVSAVNAVIHEPLKLQVCNPSLAVSSEK